MKTKDKQGPGRFKSAILNWLGFRWTDVEQWRSLYGGESKSGQVVSSETATRQASVYACTRLISQRIATLPFNVYQRVEDGREVATGHPLQRLLRRKPNAKMTAPVFWEAVVSSILLQRGAYIETVRQGAGGLAALRFLHPLRISKTSFDDLYRYTEKDGSSREVIADQVVHIPAFTTDGECGVSVIEYGLETIGKALAADEAASKMFKNGLLPTTAFTYPKILRDNQREEARTAIETLSGAANSGKPIILEAGSEAMQIGISARDGQLMESMQLSAEEVCSLFGVPPTMIGRGDKASSWASSSEQLNLWFLNYTLAPWMARIESAITDGCLTPAEQNTFYCEFNPEAMLRGDTAAQMAFFASALQNGYFNRDKVRSILNLPSMPGGDIYTVQSNLIPIDQLGADGQGENNLRSALAAFMQQGTDDET